MGGEGYFRLSRAQRRANSQDAWLKRSLYASRNFLLMIACLVCAGCHNTCISGTLNSQTGSGVNVTVSSPPPSCPPSTTSGIVRMEIGAARGSEGAAAPGVGGLHVAHLYVTLAGVDIHTSTSAGDEAPGWQRLAPELQAHPVQVDFLALIDGSAAPISDAFVTAGMYRQIRLRVASQPAEQPAREANRCPGAALHCAVLSDGQVWPVGFQSSTWRAQMQIEDGPDQALYLRPDGTVALAIDLDANRSWLWRSGESMVLHPALRAMLQKPADTN